MELDDLTPTFNIIALIFYKSGMHPNGTQFSDETSKLE